MNQRSFWYKRYINSNKKIVCPWFWNLTVPNNLRFTLRDFTFFYLKWRISLFLVYPVRCVCASNQLYLLGKLFWPLPVLPSGGSTPRWGVNTWTFSSSGQSSQNRLVMPGRGRGGIYTHGYLYINIRKVWECLAKMF